MLRVCQVGCLMLASSVPSRAMAAPLQAILVGIDGSEGWTTLQGETDVQRLEGALSRLAPDADIQLVTDSNADRQGILDALDPTRLAPASHLWVHFSGHGVQVVDTDGDEPDGLDEALVPWGATPGQVDDLLLDDTLAQHLAAVRRRLGPEGRLTVTLDACHSGGALRGVTGRADWVDPTDGEALAPMVVLSATSESELAVEQSRGVEVGGALTTALVATLQTATAETPWNALLPELGQLPTSLRFTGDPDLGLLRGTTASTGPQMSVSRVVQDTAVAIEASLVATTLEQSCPTTHGLGPSPTLPVGTPYGVEVDHHGTAPAWIEVTYRSNGENTRLWPIPDANAEPLLPGRQWRVPLCLETTLPAGVDTLVVTARSRPHTRAVRGMEVVAAPMLQASDAVTLTVIDVGESRID